MVTLEWVGVRFPHRLRRRLRAAAPFLAVGAVLVLIVECFVFNLPFFRSIPASTDSTAAMNELGPGVRRTVDGLLSVSDPTEAYVTLKADGTSPYWRMQMVDRPRFEEAKDRLPTLLEDVHVRVQCDGGTGAQQVGSVYAPGSQYFESSCSGTARVWLEEEAGSVTPLLNVRANVRVPFRFNWVRVGIGMALVLLACAFRPGSRLWRTPLDVYDRRQRRTMAAVCATVGVATLAAVVGAICWAFRMEFHKEGEYTFDFDQYDHIAQALLHGHVWLDLRVPDELAALDNPYDAAARHRLLQDGVTPIYWDYAYRDGKWYSYFGVLPALLLFVPYRAVTSLFVPGGLALPGAAAEFLFMGVATVFSLLLVTRILSRIAPRVSVGTTAVLCMAYVIGADFVYLWFHTNFYTIPIAAAMALVTAGLWLWLGAWAPDGTLRLRYVAGGSVAMAATLGCRPTFALASALVLPLFGPYALRRWRAHDRRSAVRCAAAVLAPAVVTVLPFLWYNHARFGSITDFGNAYQITVTDMTRFHTPLANLLPTLGYYFFLPPTWQSSFPFLLASPTPLMTWSFTEPSAYGLLWLMPLMAAALAIPFLRARCGRLWPMLMTALAVAAVLVVFDAAVGGYSWRYMADFGWLLMLGATVACALAMERWHWTRGIVVLAVAWALLLSALTVFVLGAGSSLFEANSGLYYEIRSWFTILE